MTTSEAPDFSGFTIPQLKELSDSCVTFTLTLCQQAGDVNEEMIKCPPGDPRYDYLHGKWAGLIAQAQAHASMVPQITVEIVRRTDAAKVPAGE